MLQHILDRVFHQAVFSRMHLDPYRPDQAGPRPVADCPTLYLHIPFCQHLCPFCSFHRVRFHSARADGYFDALRAEIRRAHEAGFRFEEVYVGGGTPTVDPAQLQRTLALVHSLWPIRAVSVETNPREIDADLLARLQDVGTTRLSVGVQSFDDGLLERLGRRQTYGDSQETQDRLTMAAGSVDVINVDLIFNLPGQTDAMIDRDLAIIQALPVQQVSWYPLMADPQRVTFMERHMGGGPASNERRFYDRIRNGLSADFVMHSPWCFCRDARMLDEYVSHLGDFLGLGSGAFSLVDRTLYSSTFSLSGYTERIRRGLPAATGYRRLTADEHLRYEFLIGLFATRLDKANLAARHGKDFSRRLGWLVRVLKWSGAVREFPDRYELTRSGQYRWVVLMREFFNGVNVLRGAMRRQIREEQAALRDHRQATYPSHPERPARVS